MTRKYGLLQCSYRNAGALHKEFNFNIQLKIKENAQFSPIFGKVWVYLIFGGFTVARFKKRNQSIDHELFGFRV